MDATYNFSLGFAQGTELRADTPEQSHKRQTLQKIWTGMSLIGLSLGFSIFGLLIIVNRHQADLNGATSGSSIAMMGGISAMLVGTAFLVAAALYWRFCAKRSTALPVKRQSARLTFSRPEPAEPIAVLY